MELKCQGEQYCDLFEMTHELYSAKQDFYHIKRPDGSKTASSHRSAEYVTRTMNILWDR